MSEFGDITTCPSHKVFYASQEEADEALARVFRVRINQARDDPPERQVYKCRFCAGWHLSSKPPELPEPEQPRLDGESWENYAHRLERRIKAQRAHIEQLNALRADAGNRAERKRLNRVQMALGKERAANYELAGMNRALVAKLRAEGKEKQMDRVWMWLAVLFARLRERKKP